MSDYPMPGPGYWYMAGPYSDAIEERYKQHLNAASILTRCKLTIYAPIIHYHHMAHTYNMPTDAEFWLEHNRNMIRGSEGVIVLCLPSWADSKGVRKELDFAKLLGMNVWALDPPEMQGSLVDLCWTKMLP